MNDIIWLLYLADVSFSLELIGFVLSFVTAVTALVMIGSCYDKKEREEIRPTTNKMFVCAAIGMLVCILLPSKNVYYAIAAAKVAEQPRVQATATKALDALDAWLDKQIEEKKGE